MKAARARRARGGSRHAISARGRRRLPLLHGPFGEDRTVQDLLDLADDALRRFGGCLRDDDGQTPDEGRLRGRGLSAGLWRHHRPANGCATGQGDGQSRGPGFPCLRQTRAHLIELGSPGSRRPGGVRAAIEAAVSTRTEGRHRAGHLRAEIRYGADGTARPARPVLVGECRVVANHEFYDSTPAISRRVTSSCDPGGGAEEVAERSGELFRPGLPGYRVRRLGAGRLLPSPRQGTSSSTRSTSMPGFTLTSMFPRDVGRLGDRVCRVDRRADLAGDATAARSALTQRRAALGRWDHPRVVGAGHTAYELGWEMVGLECRDRGPTYEPGWEMVGWAALWPFSRRGRWGGSALAAARRRAEQGLGCIGRGDEHLGAGSVPNEVKAVPSLSSRGIQPTSSTSTHSTSREVRPQAPAPGDDRDRPHRGCRGGYGVQARHTGNSRQERLGGGPAGRAPAPAAVTLRTPLQPARAQTGQRPRRAQPPSRELGSPSDVHDRAGQRAGDALDVLDLGDDRLAGGRRRCRPRRAVMTSWGPVTSSARATPSSSLIVGHTGRATDLGLDQDVGLYHGITLVVCVC